MYKINVPINEDIYGEMPFERPATMLRIVGTNNKVICRGLSGKDYVSKAPLLAFKEPLDAAGMQPVSGSTLTEEEYYDLDILNLLSAMHNRAFGCVKLTGDSTVEEKSVVFCPSRPLCHTFFVLPISAYQNLSQVQIGAALEYDDVRTIDNPMAVELPDADTFLAW